MVLENPYPPDERVDNEISILTKKGFEIILVCVHRNQNRKIESERKENLLIIRIPLSKFIYKASALALELPFYFRFWEKHLSGILNENKVDAIHIHDLPLVKVGLGLAQRYNLPLVCDYHENRPEIMKMYNHVQTFPGKYLISTKRWSNYQLKYTPRVDRLILVTDEAKDYYINQYGIDSGKITVLPNYISLERFRSFNVGNKSTTDSGKAFTAVYFGDTGTRRGTLTILDSAEILKNQDIRFLIIGDSREQETLEKKARERNLTNVTFTGRIPVIEALRLMNSSDAGLCPFLRNIHHDTTYANKMFQYMALGKPVIVSDCTSQANFVTKEDCGLIFKAGDSKELSDHILRLRDKTTYETLSKNALRCVSEKYNWEEIGSRLTELYSNL